jgi:pimeloyl-ACP methyl ester carboxylesterase
MIFQLSFRGPGGSVGPGVLKPHNGREIQQDGGLFGYDRIVFLVHGFNVQEQAGRASLSRLAKKLQQEGWAIVYVLWPGDSPIGPLSYPFTEGHQAEDTAKMLDRAIGAHVEAATPIHFVAHSLGCRVTLEVMLRLMTRANGEKGVYPIEQVVLFAGAVDDYCLSVPRKYKKAAERAERIVVLSSVKDAVCRWIYPVGDLLQSFIFFWKETFGLALGYHGPVSITTVRDQSGGRTGKWVQHDVAGNVASICIDKSHAVGHGDYLPPRENDPNDKQAYAARIARSVLAGETGLDYPPCDRPLQ